MKPLVLITARKGSKGLPGKNKKLLFGKPLIQHTIDAAREVFRDEDICVSTDDLDIIELCKEIGLDVPFVRPSELASDTASSYDVMIHAMNHYDTLNKNYDTLVLLQPTSPLRTEKHIREAMELYSDDLDMVVSVKESQANPYYNLFEEQESGFLEKSKPSEYTRRQDCPIVYEFNGAIYVMNMNSLRLQTPGQFKKVTKYVMDEQSSIDIDTQFDFDMINFILESK